MKKVVCYVQDFESYGIFVGCLLSDQNGNLNTVRRSVDFYNLISDELTKFLEIYLYTIENMEKYFRR